jgi:hypothetical protein
MNAVDILINFIADLNDFSVKDFQITLENGQNFSQANETDLQDVFLTWADNGDIIRYILLWFGTCLLFVFKSNTIGMKRYWALMILPLIFYVSFYQVKDLADRSAETYVFVDLVYLIGFVLVLNIISLVFYLATRKFTKGSKLYGFTTLTIPGFIINSIASLGAIYQTIYPPFGLMSFSFLALSQYLIFLGLYCTTAFISYEIKLRQSLYSYAEQTRFFIDTSKSYMQNKIQDKVTSIINNNLVNLREESGIEFYVSTEEAKEYVD